MASDEEDSIFNTDFVMRRPQPTPQDNDSLISTATDHRSASQNDADEEESSNVTGPSLNDLTSVSSRPDPRSRRSNGYNDSYNERRSYHSGRDSTRSSDQSGKTSDHSGSTRKASHRHQDVEARRRKIRGGYRRQQEPLYEETESEEEEGSSIVSYFKSMPQRGRRERGERGYSSGHRHSRRSRGGGFMRSVTGLFEGVSLKTVLLCVLAMVVVVQMAQQQQQGHSRFVAEGEDGDGDDAMESNMESNPLDELLKENTPKDKDLGKVSPNVRGGVVSKSPSDEEPKDEEEEALLNNGLYEEDKVAPEANPADEVTEDKKEGDNSDQQDFDMFQHPKTDTPEQGKDTSEEGNMQQQQPLDGYANNQMQNQFAQPGIVGQFPGQQQPFMQGFQPNQMGGFSNNQMGPMGGSYGQQPGMMGGQQVGMAGQPNFINGQQKPFSAMDGQMQTQLAGYTNGPMGMAGQFGQQPGVMGGQYGQQPPGMGQFGQQQGGMGGQYGQLPGGQFSQQQNLGVYGGGMQQPMYQGQPMQGQMGMGQYPEQQQVGQNSAYAPESSFALQQQQPMTNQDGMSTGGVSAPEQQVTDQVVAAAPENSDVPNQADSQAGVEQSSVVQPQGDNTDASGSGAPPGGDTSAFGVPLLPQGSTGTEEEPIPELNNFKNTWEPYETTDIPIFWHIPKAGGSSIKDSLGACHRFVQATEFGVTDGHIEDKEIAIVYPRVPGDADTDRSPFVNIDSTTVAGIQRAKEMGFADSQLADVVVSPFVRETNDLFTQTAKGRFFTVFRHPIDRAVSMFYYIQVADWEPSYRPDLKEWSLEQYAQSDIVENNWMTRQLSGQYGGELTSEHLNKAMQVVGRKIMVGLMTQIEPSMARFEKYFRWKYHVNPPNQEACRERLMSGGSNSNKSNKKPMPKEGEPAWDLLAHQNNFDLELYAYIEQMFVEQEALVTGLPDNFRNVDATCCKCYPQTFPPEGFVCPEAVKNG